jgi:hypothetical protein
MIVLQGLALPAFAAISIQQLDSFRQIQQLVLPTFSTPSVVDAIVEDAPLNPYRVAVVDSTEQKIVPHIEKVHAVSQPRVSYTASALNTDVTSSVLDQNAKTYYTYGVPVGGGVFESVLNIRAVSPVSLTALNVVYGENGYMPRSIEIRVVRDGKEEIVLAPSIWSGARTSFPVTTAQEWQIRFQHTQPLLIAEIVPEQSSSVDTGKRIVRFLAYPNHVYHLYTHADKNVYVQTEEVPLLYTTPEREILSPLSVVSIQNTSFAPADDDGDGVPNIRDNCASVPNADQIDVNQNAIGDICDDFDRDGIRNNQDNCPDQTNANQNDADGDRIGDVCDEEESRLTEKYTWLPWIGIISAALVVGVLFVLMIKHPPTIHKEESL